MFDFTYQIANNIIIASSLLFFYTLRDDCNTDVVVFTIYMHDKWRLLQ